MSVDVATYLRPWPDAADRDPSGDDLDGMAWDMPETKYHADPWLGVTGVRSASSSVLKDLLPPSTPAHARHRMLHHRQSTDFDFGSAVHKHVLSRGAEIEVVDADAWRSNEAKAQRADAYATGRIPILRKQLPAIEAAAERVADNPDVRALFAQPGADTEVVLTWRENGIACRAMLDIWTPPTPGRTPIVGDVKTIDSADDDTIGRQVVNLRYYLQDWHYRCGYYAVHGVWPAFLFVFVEREPPHSVVVREVPDVALDVAEHERNRALAVWRECIDTDIWPDRPAGLDTVRLPGWWARYAEGINA